MTGQDYETPAGAAPTVWLARFADWSDLAVFLDEVAALRFALDHGMPHVEQIPVGTLVRTAS